MEAKARGRLGGHGQPTARGDLKSFRAKEHIRCKQASSTSRLVQIEVAQQIHVLVPDQLVMPNGSADSIVGITSMKQCRHSARMPSPESLSKPAATTGPQHHGTLHMTRLSQAYIFLPLCWAIPYYWVASLDHSTACRQCHRCERVYVHAGV